MMTFSPEVQAARVAAAFERIHDEQMAGLPLLNQTLGVATLGFREHAGRVVGMLVTPWMMSVVLLPGVEDDDWQAMALGDKQTHAFPGGSFRFLVNRVDELGVFQVHSVHSPMRGFPSQSAALAEAAGFLERLLTPANAEPQQDLVDEELLGRILRGEAVPAVDAAVGAMQAGSPEGGLGR